MGKNGEKEQAKNSAEKNSLGEARPRIRKASESKKEKAIKGGDYLHE